jgi:hypothetical protein
MKFSLLLETDSPKKTLQRPGIFAVGKIEQDAQFIADDGQIFDLKRSKIEWAGATVLCISGMEPAGFERTGMQKFRYQVWYLRYLA